MDCREFLSSFTLSSIMHVGRDLNVKARNLVKLGKLYGSRTWLEGVPYDVPNLVVLVPLF